MGREWVKLVETMLSKQKKIIGEGECVSEDKGDQVELQKWKYL